MSDMSMMDDTQYDGPETIDLTDVEDAFKPMPAGIYEAEVASITRTKSGPNSKKYPNTPMLKFEFNITEEPFENRKAWTNVMLVADSLGILKRYLKNLGWSDEELSGELNLPELCEEAEGRACRLQLTVGVNPNTKEPNNSVKSVLSATEGSSDLPS